MFNVHCASIVTAMVQFKILGSFFLSTLVSMRNDLLGKLSCFSALNL